jgi:hypothetical protein
MKSLSIKFVSAGGVIFPALANAASLEGTLTSLVTSFVGRLLPILALGYLAKNIFGHVQSDPNAKNDTPRIVIACACLLAINAVWAYIRDNVR